MGGEGGASWKTAGQQQAPSPALPPQTPAAARAYAAPRCHFFFLRSPRIVETQLSLSLILHALKSYRRGSVTRAKQGTPSEVRVLSTLVTSRKAI